MSIDTFEFENIAGKPATLKINDTDTHQVVRWGDLTISDASGDVGFWSAWHKTGKPWLTGAARDAALHAYARETIESEIYAHIEHLQTQLAEMDDD